MAVVFITKLENNYGEVSMMQGDKKRNPRMDAQTFTAGEAFNPNITNWGEFTVPWAEAGSLSITTEYDYTCVVGSTATDPNNDYIQVTSSKAPGFTVNVGAKGRQHKCCTLRIKSDGKIEFSDVKDC